MLLAVGLAMEGSGMLGYFISALYIYTRCLTTVAKYHVNEHYCSPQDLLLVQLYITAQEHCGIRAAGTCFQLPFGS